jgi:hypothetical protein
VFCVGRYDCSDLLVKDYEHRRHELKQAQRRLEELKERHGSLARDHARMENLKSLRLEQSQGTEVAAG